MAKTRDDWFLRGGERPDPAENSALASPAHGDGDGEVLKDYIVTMSRTRSVQQTAKVRVKAHSAEEAMELVEDQAPDEASGWNWKDVDYSNEFEDMEATGVEEVI